MPSWPIEEIRTLLEPSVRHLGYSIYSIEQTGSDGRTLRIAIDKAAGFVSLDDCERVSQVAGPILDQADLIPSRYTLEVSSPGAERPLRDRGEFDRFLGHKVNVRHRYGETSEAVIEGTLKRVDDAGITVEAKGGRAVDIGWPEILAARLAVSL
jgi:ribosome maturation factor RimP